MDAYGFVVNSKLSISSAQGLFVNKLKFLYRWGMLHIPPYNIPLPGGPSQTAAGKPFVLAHFSDLHMAPQAPVHWRDLANKRILGYLGWKLRRSAEHQDGILDVLRKDLERSHPDHIAVTGDLTHLGLPSEFKKTRRWLQTLGAPADVTVVPGNHDTYVRTDWHRTFALWSDYMASDRSSREKTPVTGFDDLFPVVRVRNGIILIGLCTAHPNPPHLATGRIGIFQMKRLETILKHTVGGRFFRIIMIHHPPISGVVSHRKRLADSAALSRLIGRYGTELILHGHSHKTTHVRLHSPWGSTTVAGAPSASSPGRTQDRRARYFLYGILLSTKGWDVNIAERIYSPEADRFISGKERCFHVVRQED